MKIDRYHWRQNVLNRTTYQIAVSLNNAPDYRTNGLWDYWANGRTD